MQSAAAGVHMGCGSSRGRRRAPYWPVIAEQYKLDLTITNDAVDPTFRFMTLDWDGKDPYGSFLAQRDAAPDWS